MCIRDSKIVAVVLLVILLRLETVCVCVLYWPIWHLLCYTFVSSIYGFHNNIAWVSQYTRKLQKIFYINNVISFIYCFIYVLPWGICTLYNNRYCVYCCTLAVHFIVCTHNFVLCAYVLCGWIFACYIVLSFGIILLWRGHGSSYCTV